MKHVDPLRRDDIERARAASPAEKLKQALAIVNEGVGLKRAALRARFPELAEEAIDAKLLEWLQEPR
jgi:hypothetical protein